MEIVKNIIYNILALQEQFLKKRLSKTITAKNMSNKKRHYINGCTIDISSLADDKKKQLEEELINIIKANNFNPKEILKYIESQGTKVIVTKRVKSILAPINEQEGFIYPLKGYKALYISLAINKNISLKTKEMFILSEGKINKYYFLYHLYNWFAYKHNLAGLNRTTQDLLKKYLFETNDTKNLQLSEIYELKDAIQQDKSAIEFVIKFSRNNEGSKQALLKMKEFGSTKL